MIPYRNSEIFASVIFFFVIKIICSLTIWYRGMYRKQQTLTSIPERNENEDEPTKKWVPKNKHEVLKAKYKCLKKLFQVYDASVIGILPESYGPDYYLEENIKAVKRKRRSHCTKKDACADTAEVSSGDINIHSDTERESIATAVIRDLKITKCSSTQMECIAFKDYKYAATQDSRENLIDRHISAERERQECEFTQTSEPQPIPYLVINEKRKLTRFQRFIQRIFGIREKSYKNYVLPNGHAYAASDNLSQYCGKRRRTGLRFRRLQLQRPKKTQSETALKNIKSPAILTYVQSVQRNCLMDTTPRHCPILGCLKISYGIINYNDHLNLCHFTDRKYICHYCHEGFERQYDKFVHENEHIGISKLEGNISVPSTTRQFSKKASNTQTDPEISKCDVPEDKLKKIVSFFDRISDPDQILTEIKKNRYPECSPQRSKTETNEKTEESSDSSEQKTVSCLNIHRKTDKSKSDSSSESDMTMTHAQFSTPINCHICGENFNYRRQLYLHMELEHRVHSNLSKFHDSLNKRHRVDMVSEDGKIKVQSIDRDSGIRRSNSSLSQSYCEVSRKRSEENTSDPSTNILCYTSETVKKPSVANGTQKVQSGFSYKWEPGTKIIHV